jgi:hypothetical protein
LILVPLSKKSTVPLIAPPPALTVAVKTGVCPKTRDVALEVTIVEVVRFVWKATGPALVAAK